MNSNVPLFEDVATDLYIQLGNLKNDSKFYANQLINTHQVILMFTQIFIINLLKSLIFK